MDQLNAMKNFKITTEGPDELSMVHSADQSADQCRPVPAIRRDMGNGVMVPMAPLPAGVRPCEGWKNPAHHSHRFDDTDAQSWTIKPGAWSLHRLAYLGFPVWIRFQITGLFSDRLLYPLKRVDFDPRVSATKNRGVSGYEISWDGPLTSLRAKSNG